MLELWFETALDGDAVGHALACESGRGSGQQELVRELDGPGSVFQGRVRVARVYEILDVVHLGGEFRERSEHARVVAPVGREALPEVLLVDGVHGQDLDGGHDGRRLRLVGDGVEEEPLRVLLQLGVVRGAGLRDELARHAGLVGHVARVRVLAEVHRGVVARRHPGDRRQRVNQRLHRVERRPPGRVALVAMANSANLRPPRLQLFILLHNLVSLVEDPDMVRHVFLHGCPQLKPVRCVGVILDHELHPAFRRRVAHRHPPEFTH
jgi:hypothetical protein